MHLYISFCVVALLTAAAPRHLFYNTQVCARTGGLARSDEQRERSVLSRDRGYPFDDESLWSIDSVGPA